MLTNTTSDFKIQAFVINLDQSTERMYSIEKQAAKIGISLNRVPAILGRAVNLSQTNSVDPNGYALRHGRNINVNEVGCYLSHLCALRAFLDSDALFGIILEDDAELPLNYLDIISELVEKKWAWDIVKFSAFHSGTPLRIEPIGDQSFLSIPLSRVMNANNILYSRAAAEKLLDVLDPMQLPFDHALERAWLFGLRLRVISPYPCSADTGHPSTIAHPEDYRLVWYKRLPCMGFRLITELLRLIFGMTHYFRYKLFRV